VDPINDETTRFEKAVVEATTKLSAEYPVEIWDTTIKGLWGTRIGLPM